MAAQKIAFITDLHLDDEVSAGAHGNPRPNLERVLDDIRTREIRHIIIGGDLGDASALPWLFEHLKDFRVEFILGNHDHYNSVLPYMQQQKGESGELFYSIDEEGFRYVFLDSSSETLSKAQLTWLAQQLNTSLQLLLFIHHPVLPIDAAVDRLYPLKNRESAAAILRQSGKIIDLFSGHCHTADEKKEGSLRQYVSPSVSFQALKGTPDLQFDNSRFGYSIIHLGDVADVEVVWFSSEVV